MTTPDTSESSTYRCKYGETEKLTSHNYQTWYQDMEPFLIGADALRIVLGEELAPGGLPTSAAAKDFRLRSGVAVAMIHASCTASVKAHITGIRDPDRMWLMLKEKHDTANSRNGQQSVFREFANLRPLNADSSINDYVMRMKRCQNELRETELAINDLMFTNQLLNHLPSTFNVIKRLISDKPLEVQTADYVIDKILEEERVIRSENLSSSNLGMTSSKALAATTAPPRHPQTHQPNLSRLKCWSCGRLGHRRADCKKNGRSRNRSFKHRKQQAAASVAAASASAASAAAAGVSEDRAPLFDYEVQCLVAGTPSSTSSSWIIDSGATHHLCNDKTLFSTLGRLGTEINVALGDGSVVPAPASGTLTLRLSTGASIVLEALYAPKLRQSLISVSKLALAHQIVFGSKECHLNGELLGIYKNGVYELAGAVSKEIARASVAAVSKAPTKERWHQRLGHLGDKAVKALLKMHSTLPSAVSNAVSDADLSDVDSSLQPALTPNSETTLTSDSLCVVCVKAKHQRKIQRAPVAHVTRPLELIHSDLAGPITPPSSSGKRYFILYIDDFSRVASVFFLRGKSAEEVTSVFQEFKASMEKRYPDYPITRFRCDNGRGEYDNSLFRGILRVSGIRFEPSPPYTQHKNGVSERMIRTLTTKARAMMLDARMEEVFWAEAVNTAAYLHARSPSASVGGRTPYEMLNGQGNLAPIHHLRRFGCAAYKRIPKEQRTGKFSARSRECTMLGYVHETTKIWKLWDPIALKVSHVSDVIFNEDKIIGIRPVDLPDAVLRSCLPEEDCDIAEEDRPPPRPLTLAPQPGGIRPSLPSAGQFADLTLPSEMETTASSLPSEMEISETSEISQNGLPSPPAASKPPLHRESEPPYKPSTREAVPIHTPTPRRSSRLGGVRAAAAAVTDGDQGDPTSYREALDHVNAVKWKEAMRREHASHAENRTWDYVSAPRGCKPLSCRWVLLTKNLQDGGIRHKARLVAKGYLQKDPGETFAPVAKLTSLRMLLALAARNQWEIDQMDVVTAFLNPPINEEIFMTLPEGTDWLEPKLVSSRNTVCKLNKALYGLKQSPRLWYKHIAAFFKSIGFEQSTNDPALYVRSSTGSAPVLILLYVDDLLIASGSRELVDLNKARISKQYKMTDLGPAKRFLNLQIERLSNGDIRLGQSIYVERILERFDMSSCNGTATPMETKRKLASTQDSNPQLAVSDDTQKALYQSLIGNIMYLMTSTRPDLAFALSALSQHLVAPTEADLQAAKRVLRYVSKTRHLALTYSRSPVSEITGFTDSDWAGETEARKSTAGYVFTLQGAAISWKSKKQTIVALSSTEAEYIGSTEAAKEAIWLQRLYSDLNPGIASPPPLPLYVDNQGAIKLAENPRFHERTKHIDIKYHFVREAREQGLIDVNYLSTAEMTADVLTKALSRDAHQRHTTGMGLR